jgi:hypothetical protein
LVLYDFGLSNDDYSKIFCLYFGGTYMANITSITAVAKPETAAQVLVLALCVSVGVAGLLLSHSHFRSAPQAAEIPSASGHTGGHPLVW